MLDRNQILGLIPHQAAMCLLDTVAAWSACHVVCHASSHLDPGNPLRRHGRLSMACGVEFGLQAAALHGALVCGARRERAMLAALRGVALHRARLDDPAIGRLHVEARREAADAAALIYRFDLRSEAGIPLSQGRAVIALLPP